MKAVRIDTYGSAELLQYETVENPVINDNQLLVQVYATSVNHLEIKKASGVMQKVMPLDFPWTPGYDFAGVVVAVGSKVKGFSVGDEVYGNCNGGSYAEYLVADPDLTVKKPESFSFIEAATVPHVGETAWQAINVHGKLKKDQKVLIHGGAGAVGAFAVQFAHAIGAMTYATASEKDREYLISLGTHVVIDYKNSDFTELAKDMDLVIDLIGGETQHKSYLILKKGGKLISTVGVSDESAAEAESHGVKAIAMVIKQSGKDLEKITEMINAGKLKTVVAKVYPLNEADKAWNVMMHKDPEIKITRGKIVLQID